MNEIIKTTQETFNKETEEVKDATEVEETTEKPASNIFRLDEMLDAIEYSINNINTVVAEHTKLIDVLDKHEPNEFTELKDSFKAQIEQMNAQISELTNRQQQLKYVLACCIDSEETSQIVDKLMLGLGIIKE